MTRINILSATDRPNSNALKVAKYAERTLSKKAETKTFSLKDFPLQDVAGGKYGNAPESVEKFVESFLEADGFLFVVPEYNGGFPGVLKVFIDYLPFPKAMNRVPVSLIGEADGAFGALRPVEHLEQILKYRKAIIFPERMFIQRVNNNFDPEKGIKSEMLEELLQKQLNDFPEFVEAVTQKLVDA